MNQNNITLDYDDEADVLYLSFGKPRAAITEEVGNIGIRIDEKTKKIVGITVMQFLKTVREKHQPIKITV